MGLKDSEVSLYNFVYHDNKEENVKDLNDLIQAIEKYRDSL